MAMSYHTIVVLILVVFVFIGSGQAIAKEGIFGLVWCLFLLPVMWCLWFLVAVLDERIPKWQLIGLWFGIDLAALVVLRALIANAQKMTGPPGDDVGVIIAFSPFLLPVILISRAIPIIGSGMAAIGNGAVIILLPEKHSNSIEAWLALSIMTAISCWIFVSICRNLRRIFKKVKST